MKPRRQFSQAPPGLFLLAVFALLGFLLGREASPGEALPAFSVDRAEKVYVELLGAVESPGVYQLSDASHFSCVIELTAAGLPRDLLERKLRVNPLRSGEVFNLRNKPPEIEHLQRGWMHASHRMALGIPLHPDRMSLEDWPVLPGLGPVLASRIENYRQDNGDFGSLEALQRVKGIGPKRISSWSSFF